MLDSYFFIPGDKPIYLSKIDKIDADFIVIDLEDAVSTNKKKLAIDLVLGLVIKDNMFVRIPFFDKVYTRDQLKKLIFQFEGRIVLPKINSIKEIEEVVSLSQGLSLKMIVLIENAGCFIAITDILKLYYSQIHAIGFGSHDFCTSTGIKHTLANLAHYKKHLILYAKAYNVSYIDSVDLNLKNYDQFKEECIFAFEAGADGKFLIHPNQLKELYEVVYLKNDELNQLNLAYEKIKDISIQDIEVLTIDGNVYEKPHFYRVKHLINKIQISNKRKKNS
jgi:citrate lyase beta subunit